jgi:hypothetical protein
LWYKKNKDISACDDPNGAGMRQMTWLKKQLEELDAQGKKAYVIGHIPPEEKGPVRLYKDCYFTAYLNVMGDHGHVVHAELFGHTNDDQFSILVKPEGKRDHELVLFTPSKAPPPLPKSYKVDHLIFIGPSLIPAVNPAYREFIVDGATGNPLDYVQYFMDLKKANVNKNKLPQWEEEYRLLSAYAMKEWCEESWKHLFERLEAQQTKWDSYKRYFYVSAPAPPPPPKEKER